MSDAALACVATLELIHGVAVLRLPDEASARLPSRGQVAVAGRIAEVEVETVLEPDGRRGHWLRLDQVLPGAELAVGEQVSVDLSVIKDWPEPEVPADLATALGSAPEEIRQVWHDITAMARWEWVRWVNATRNPQTRQRRVEVSISKLGNGKRRPCCFDLSSCTDPELARSGKLPQEV